MKASIAIDCIFIAGFTYYGFVPFDKKRMRAGWAKLVFLISAFIGVAKGAIGLAWDMGWFALDVKANWLLNSLLYGDSGLLLGLILALILSGQLSGTKRVVQELGHEPTG